MVISDKTFLTLLERYKALTPEQIIEITQDSERTKTSLQETTIKKRLLEESDIIKLFSDYTQIPYAEINPRDISEEALNKIPEHIARQYNAVVFEINKDTNLIHLAMEDPDDVRAVNTLQKYIGTNIRIYITTKNTILSALEAYRGDVDKEIDQVVSDQTQSIAEDQIQSVREEDVAENSPIAKTVNLLLEYAIKSNASDVHIEPRDSYIQVRYRIDGVLKEVNQLPKSISAALVSRIKILSNLKIDERRVPQDGRFKIRFSERQFAFRVSTLPIAEGEKVVMRILNESTQALTFQQLGFWGRSLEVFESALTEPNGMVLVTGPTGSGKSTTLFSSLSRLNTPSVNISTIEDPVEYRIPGVNQTQTNNKAGMTFANGLRALLRQDPNIIMVGEIRDSETANLGVQAALTGHLVFSTLHTNNAATTLPRLLDMQIEPFLISSTVKAIVGQRLVRRLRPTTRVQYIPTEEEKEHVRKLLGLKPGDSFERMHELEKQAAAAGIGGDAPLSTSPTGINFLWRAKEDDMEEGAQNGFKGRIGIYEVLGMTNQLQHLITSNATSNEIQDEAVRDGMLTMQTDGIIKALRGNTTIDEVQRATKE